MNNKIVIVIIVLLVAGTALIGAIPKGSNITSNNSNNTLQRPTFSGSFNLPSLLSLKIWPTAPALPTSPSQPTAPPNPTSGFTSTPTPAQIPTTNITSAIYVSTTGNDNNNGSQNSPFRTVNKGISVAQPGSVVRIKPGTYSEKVTISGKIANVNNPIKIAGDSLDPAQYPIMDGGDAGFSATGNIVDSPVFRIQNSYWLVFERLKIINSTQASYFLDNSHYITFRRNIIDYHRAGILLRNKSSHILLEYSELFQSFPSGMTWSQLKGSNWEGGGFTSWGGAGMNIIRYNYFRRQMNGVVLYKSNRVGNYYDANVWIYRNRFEDVVDDPYEPESYAYNNHFFANTLINTHRMASFAPGNLGLILGPIYVYNNMQILTKDPTGEAASGRANSAYKVELGSNYFQNGVYLFNNSVDVSAAGTNGYGIDFLSSTVNRFNHNNHAYRTLNTTFSKSTLSLLNSNLDYDMSQTLLGYLEANGFPSINPQFTNPALEDLRLTSVSPARGKSKEIRFNLGFSSSLIIPAGADLGAFQFGENNFRNTPLPVYSVPPGGEDPTFPNNTNHPADTEGGINPLSGPRSL